MDICNTVGGGFFLMHYVNGYDLIEDMKNQKNMIIKISGLYLLRNVSLYSHYNFLNAINTTKQESTHYNLST